MPKGRINKRCTPEFKIKVVETMRTEHLSYHESARQYDVSNHHIVAKRERIYLEEGKEGFYVESRGGADRRITKELRKTHLVNHNKIQRLVRKIGIFRHVRMKKYNSFKGKVAAYNLSYYPNLNQVTDMLNKPFAKIPDNTNLILHFGFERAVSAQALSGNSQK